MESQKSTEQQQSDRLTPKEFSKQLRALYHKASLHAESWKEQQDIVTSLCSAVGLGAEELRVALQGARKPRSFNLMADEEEALREVLREFDHGREKHGFFTGLFSALAVLEAEVGEFKASIHSRESDDAMDEAIDVAAVALAIWVQYSRRAVIARNNDSRDEFPDLPWTPGIGDPVTPKQKKEAEDFLFGERAVAEGLITPQQIEAGLRSVVYRLNSSGPSNEEPLLQIVQRAFHAGARGSSERALGASRDARLNSAVNAMALLFQDHAPKEGAEFVTLSDIRRELEEALARKINLSSEIQTTQDAE